MILGLFCKKLKFDDQSGLLFFWGSRFGPVIEI